jgi:hypothetical protein
MILKLPFLNIAWLKDQCHTDVKELSHNVKQFRLALSNFLHLSHFVLYMSILVAVRSKIRFHFINVIIAIVLQS